MSEFHQLILILILAIQAWWIVEISIELRRIRLVMSEDTVRLLSRVSTNLTTIADVETKKLEGRQDVRH